MHTDLLCWDAEPGRVARGVSMVAASTQGAAILRVIGVTPVRYQLLAGARVMVGVCCVGTAQLARVAVPGEHGSTEGVAVPGVIPPLLGGASLAF